MNTPKHTPEPWAPVRETCTVCGMVANLDPWFHAERYKHTPRVRRNGVEHIHNGHGAFVPVRGRK